MSNPDIRRALLLDLDDEAKIPLPGVPGVDVTKNPDIDRYIVNVWSKLNTPFFTFSPPEYSLSDTTNISNMYYWDSVRPQGFFVLPIGELPPSPGSNFSKNPDKAIYLTHTFEDLSATRINPTSLQCAYPLSSLQLTFDIKNDGVFLATGHSVTIRPTCFFAKDIGSSFRYDWKDATFAGGSQTFSIPRINTKKIALVQALSGTTMTIPFTQAQEDDGWVFAGIVFGLSISSTYSHPLNNNPVTGTLQWSLE